EMMDVIFQGSRNRPPSGMAEVVLHLVRDEVIEAEPDIQDIDSQLEQIDEHSAAFEPVDVATSEPEATVSEPRQVGVATGSENQPASVSESSAESTHKSKQHHHRHWRQRRNLALEFASGEAVSVTRRLYR